MKMMKTKWKNVVSCTLLSVTLFSPLASQPVSAQESTDVPKERAIPTYVDISPRYPTISKNTSHTTTFKWGGGNGTYNGSYSVYAGMHTVKVTNSKNTQGSISYFYRYSGYTDTFISISSAGGGTSTMSGGVTVK